MAMNLHTHPCCPVCLHTSSGAFTLHLHTSGPAADVRMENPLQAPASPSTSSSDEAPEVPHVSPLAAG